MKKDETKEISKTYDAKEENKDLAGKTKKISVTVKAIKLRNLPALDDELAQDVSEKYKTLDDLKKIFQKVLKAQKIEKLQSSNHRAFLSSL